MKVPNKIKVGGITYAVEVGNKVLHDETNTWGMITHAMQKIQLDGEMAQDRLGETLLHELLHASFTLSGFSELVKNPERHFTEEELVNALAKSLYTIITDNKLSF